jgi:hypothetical protein
MTAAPAAASVPSTPGPLPPPVDGAPIGRPVPFVPVPTPVGKGLAVPFAPAVPVPSPLPVANADAEWLVLGEAEHDGEADAEAEADALGEADALADADADMLAEGEAEALVVGVQLLDGSGLHDGEGEVDAELEGEVLALGEVEADALAEAEALAEALCVGPQVDAAADATPPSGPVKATTATEASSEAAPVARPTSPARCSFSQLICRDRRKIVTNPSVVRFIHSGPYTQVLRFQGNYISAQLPKWPFSSTITMIPGEHCTTNSLPVRCGQFTLVGPDVRAGRSARSAGQPRCRSSPRAGVPGGGMTAG